MGWSPVDDVNALAGLHATYAAGVNVFDTADVYGHGLSERRLGRLLAVVPRDQVVVSSKVGYHADVNTHPYQPAQMRRQLALTLANLGTDYLDVYAFHSNDFGPNDAYLADAVAQMAEFRDRELIRAVSMRAPHEFAAEWTHDPAQPRGQRAMRFLQLFHRIRPDLLAVRYNILSPAYQPAETDIFAFARANHVGVLVKQVLAQGLLTGNYRPEHPTVFGPGDHRTGKPWFSPRGLHIIHKGLQPLRERFGTSPADLAQAAIGYCLQTAPQALALIGFRNADQVAINTAGLDAPLSPDDISTLRVTGQRIRQSLDAAFDPAADPIV